MQYDLVILGREYAGLRAAHLAARHRMRVALVDFNTQTLDTRSERETPSILHDLAEIQQNYADLIPETAPFPRQFSIFSRHFRELCHTDRVLQVKQLQDQGVTFLSGKVKWGSPTQLEVNDADNRTSSVSAGRVLLAASSRHRTTAGLRCNGRDILSGDQLLDLPILPGKIVVVGGGRLGMAWGNLLSQLGAEVTVVEGNGLPASSISELLTPSQIGKKRDRMLRLVSGYDAIGVESGHRRGVSVILENGLRIPGEIVLLAQGRQILTDTLQLHRQGILRDERGRVWNAPLGRGLDSPLLPIGQTISYPEFRRYESVTLEKLVPASSVSTLESRPEQSAVPAAVEQTTSGKHAGQQRPERSPPRIHSRRRPRASVAS